MFKRLLATLGILAGLLSPVYAAGTIPGISMTQQLDQYAKPLSGGLLYLIQAGTTSTPQSCYQDTGLTLPWPNPVILDAAGRVPQLICADGSIKIRLTDKNGVQQLVQDNILIIGASSGSGGGGSVDATTVLATGDIKQRYGTGSLSGFVRLNGRTIGSATSGATERANADTQALFEYLWGADESLAVSGGRGASANADWVANKTITLPDGRARALMALADMGNTASTAYDPVTFSSGGPTTLGSLVGGAYSTITQATLPAISYSLTGTSDPVSVASTVSGIPSNMTNSGQADMTSSIYNAPYFASSISLGQITSTGTFTPRGSIGPLGSGSILQTSSRFLFVTTYMKL